MESFECGSSEATQVGNGLRYATDARLLQIRPAKAEDVKTCIFEGPKQAYIEKGHSCVVAMHSCQSGRPVVECMEICPSSETHAAQLDKIQSDKIQSRATDLPMAQIGQAVIDGLDAGTATTTLVKNGEQDAPEMPKPRMERNRSILNSKIFKSQAANPKARKPQAGRPPGLAKVLAMEQGRAKATRRAQGLAYAEDDGRE